MLTIDDIKKVVAEIAPQYNLKKVTLFGSRANGNATEKNQIEWNKIPNRSYSSKG